LTAQQLGILPRPVPVLVARVTVIPHENDQWLH
jgi:hypothetical protein